MKPACPANVDTVERLPTLGAQLLTGVTADRDAGRDRASILCKAVSTTRLKGCRDVAVLKKHLLSAASTRGVMIVHALTVFTRMHGLLRQ